jgi:hypothetical protein
VPLCEKMWKNRVKPNRPQMTIWRMRFTCPITKAKKIHTLVIFNTLCFTTVTVVTRTHLNVPLYSHTQLLQCDQAGTYIAWLVSYSQRPFAFSCSRRWLTVCFCGCVQLMSCCSQVTVWALRTVSFRFGMSMASVVLPSVPLRSADQRCSSCLVQARQSREINVAALR